MYHNFETYIRFSHEDEPYRYCVDCGCQEEYRLQFPECEDYENYLKIDELLSS